MPVCGGCRRRLRPGGPGARPLGADQWTDGVAGARLWVLVGLVPVVVAGLIAAQMVSPRRGALLSLALATTAVLATVAGEWMHLSDPPGGRQLLGSLGAGLDVVAVAVAGGMLATLLRPRSRPLGGAARPRCRRDHGDRLRADDPCDRDAVPVAGRVPAPGAVAHILGEPGENVLLALLLGPCSPAGSSCRPCSAPASTSGEVRAGSPSASWPDRRRRRDAAGPAARPGGGGDDFLVALPRAVGWATVAAGMAATIIQSQLGDAPGGAEVAVGVSVVSILGAAAGVASFAADATTAGPCPTGAAALSVAALFLPRRRPARADRADRWLLGEVGSDAQLIDSFGAAAARRPRRRARPARRHVPTGAPTALGQGVDGRPNVRSVAVAGIEPTTVCRRRHVSR